VSDDTFGLTDWTVYAHPLFLDQFETMIAASRRRARRIRRDTRRSAREAPVGCLEGAFDDIPSDQRVTSIGRAHSRDEYKPGSARNCCSSSPVLPLSAIGDAKIIVSPG